LGFFILWQETLLKYFTARREEMLDAGFSIPDLNGNYPYFIQHQVSPPASPEGEADGGQAVSDPF
jgi:hypothetical protein